MSTTNFTTQR